MDSITHGSLGILAAVLAAPPGLRRQAALAGLIAAELPDLDVFLVSPGDPLFSLQMHRHFSHALLMIPLLGVLGVILANGLGKLFRRAAVWRGLWLPAMAAAATHGLCDTWTSYGTHLLWPFTDRRESWDLISVIDPLMTLPLLVCAVLAWKRAARGPAWMGCGWVALYLSLCMTQQQRATVAVREWAQERGHAVERLTVKPSFGNIMVWRGLYAYEGICQVVCVRAGLTEDVRVLGTAAATLLHPDRPVPPLDALPTESVQMEDVRRFRHFSDDWLGVHPRDPLVIGDLRYATRPDLISPLWGIVLDPAQPDGHVKLENFRSLGGAMWGELWRMITGSR